MGKRLRTIYVLCGNAAYNRGDRGNLLAQLRLLQSAFPKAQLVLDSYRPDVDRRWYEATVLPRGVFLNRQQWRYLRRADAVVWGGGALIADNSCRTLIPYWVIVIWLVKFVLRKPVMAWAHGVVLETNLGTFLARYVYDWVDLITVRDANSLAALRRAGVSRTPLYQTADPAVTVQPSGVDAGERLLRESGIPVSGARPADSEARPDGRPADSESRLRLRLRRGEAPAAARLAQGRRPDGRPADGESRLRLRLRRGEAPAAARLAQGRRPDGRPADSEARPDGRPLVAISPTFWMFYNDKRDIIPFMFARKLGLRSGRGGQRLAEFTMALGELADRLVEELGATVLFLPRYPCAPWDDVTHLLHVKRKARHGRHIFVWQRDDNPPQDYLALWHSFDLVISVALHDALFATALGPPCVQLYYEPKGKDLARALGAQGRMADWAALFEGGGVGRVMRLAKSAYGDQDGAAAEIQTRRDSLQKLARRNVAYLREMLRAHGYSV